MFLKKITLTELFFKKKNQSFIIVGIVNTISGYVLSLIIYYLLNKYYNILVISLIINFVNISFSFVTFKLFVFNHSKLFWLTQYLKSFMTYGLISVIHIIIMVFMVEILNFKFFFVATFLIVASPLFLYFMHKNFTYNEKN
jgi:putative flippase GtrA